MTKPGETSLLEIDMLHVFDWMPEKTLPELLKLLGGVGSKKLHPGNAATLCLFRQRRGNQLLKPCCDRTCGGLGRVYDADVIGGNALQYRLEQGIMRAAEHHGVRVAKSIGEGFAQIDAGDFLRDGMLDPSFLHERDQQGTGFLARL